jgi:hypothetical protein
MSKPATGVPAVKVVQPDPRSFAQADNKQTKINNLDNFRVTYAEGGFPSQKDKSEQKSNLDD